MRLKVQYQGSYRCRYPDGQGHGGGGPAILGLSELQQRRLVLLGGSPVGVLHLDFMVEQYHVLNYESKVSV
jgi:hypothetical protein